MADQSPFIWHELVTSDQAISGAFFSQLLGWTRKEVDAGPFGVYTLFQKSGQDIAGMMNPTPDTPGKGSYWHFYIAVEDVDDCARRALSIGGKVVVPPHDVPDVGRICIVADQTGAMAHLMQPLKPAQPLPANRRS
jgi:predicted enzyme related to lactoylglutathione lyase